MRRFVLAAGADTAGSTPAKFQAFLIRDTERWTQVLNDNGARK